MTLCEELYFEITLKGEKSDIKKFVSFLRSGGLDDFFEISSDYIHFEDDYETHPDDADTTLILSNDDYGIEIDEFDTEEFLEVFSRAAKDLHVNGRFFDVDDDEYSFISPIGDSYYINASKFLSYSGDNADEDDYDDTY